MVAVIETEKGKYSKACQLTAQESRSLKYGFQGRVTSIIDKSYFRIYLKDKLFNQFN